MTTQTDKTIEQRDALAARLFQASAGTAEVFTAYIGERLGLYSALRQKGALTSPELAACTGVAERYAREWLEQQAVAGILTVDDVAAPPQARRYTLPEGHAEVLLDCESLAYLTPFLRAVASVGRTLPQVLEAFRTGEGVPWDAYGDDLREAQAGMNRPHFLTLLGSDWFPKVPDVHARLQADPPARVADIACGAGWSSIAIAKAYPNVRVDGFDLDAPAIEMARANAIAAGVADRVAFYAQDAAQVPATQTYDLAVIFEAVHDMAQPVSVLATVRRIVGPSGAVIVMDERVEETFMAPGSDFERLFYAISVLTCLPNGLAESPSVGTGTVMRPSALRAYAREAGFKDMTVLPIEHDQFRFYRLVR
jgi:2-polyprenyl-3-methyl-5-hydroxy-6-metoxy-1,4-benzoquinol methylase